MNVITLSEWTSTESRNVLVDGKETGLFVELHPRKPGRWIGGPWYIVEDPDFDTAEEAAEWIVKNPPI